MAYTETTTTGYGTRVGNSFKQIGTGFLMFVAGTVLLFWNEGRTIHREQDINFADANCVEMASPDKVDPTMDGKLVHTTGQAVSTDILDDGTFPVAGNYMMIDRNVEYFQVVERKEEKKRDKLGGGEEVVTTYHYDTKWVDDPVNSANFHDPSMRNANGVLVKFDDQQLYAEHVNFGAYKLPDFFIKSVGTAEDVQVFQDPTEYAKALVVPPADGTEVELTEEDVARACQNLNTDFSDISGNVVYYGNNPGAPQVGDVRVTFKAIKPVNDISIMAQASGDTFTKFKSKNDNFAEIRNGIQTKEQMVQAAHDENAMLKWALRLLGTLLVIGGLKGIFNFLVILLKVVPFLATIMNFGVGLICTVLGIAWSLIIIGIAWVFYRPVLGISLLVIAAGLIAYLVIRGKNKKPAVQPVPANNPAGPAPGVQQPMPQQPYQAPQQPQQPYQAPQQPQQPYQAPEQPVQQPYQAPEQPMQQPYQAPEQPMQQPQYPQQPQMPQQPMQDPYGQPMQQPQYPQYPQQPQYPQYPQQPQQPQYPDNSGISE